MQVKQQIRNSVVFFFVLLLLLPLAEKIIHDHHHAGETHCTEKSLLHFHATEHDCSLCGLEVTQAADLHPVLSEKQLNVTEFFYLAACEEAVKQGTTLRLPARAPPLS